MRRRDEVSLLRAITEIRDLQRAAAEMEAARAAAALREKNDVKSEAERACQSSEERWLNAVQAPAIRLDVMPLWSAHVIREGESARRASSDAEAASAELKRRATDWHAAVARRDAAGALACEAAKDEQRRREEAALQEAADRHARRRGIP
jgi:hypothetical protein